MNRVNNFLFRSTLGLLLLAAAPGCEVLTQEPPASLTQEDTFTSPDRVSKAVISMYDAVQNNEFLGGRVLVYGDVRSDDTDPAAFFTTVSNFTQLANDGTSLNAWTGGYRTLYSINFFLQNLQANPGVVSSTLEKQYTAEGRFLRALTMFHLVNLYAQPYKFTADASHPGIPIQLTAPNAAQAFEPSQQLARSSVRDVYTQIEADLMAAITDLPESYAAGQELVGRATKDGARGLLSRVYLYKGDFTNAATYSGQVITGGRHTLNADPVTPFRNFLTSESVFSIAMNASDNPNTNNALGQHYGAPPLRGDITINPYVAIVPAGDKRLTNLTARPATNYYSTKFYNPTNTTTAVQSYVPIVRYSEVLLNNAEALARTTGVTSDAVTRLNLVRDRSKPTTAASYSVSSFANAQALIDAILLERRLELAFEGHRLYDLLRTRTTGQVVVPTRGSSPAQNYGSDRLVFPIPLVDLQQNPNLVPNPGY